MPSEIVFLRRVRELLVDSPGKVPRGNSHQFVVRRANKLSGCLLKTTDKISFSTQCVTAQLSAVFIQKKFCDVSRFPVAKNVGIRMSDFPFFVTEFPLCVCVCVFRLDSAARCYTYESQ